MPGDSHVVKRKGLMLDQTRNEAVSMTPDRWQWECAGMQRYPLFRPIYTSTQIGFEGIIGRNGILFEVTVMQRIDRYPAVVPDVFVHPCPKRYLKQDGSIGICSGWSPKRSACSFAWLIYMVTQVLSTMDESELELTNVLDKK